MRSKVLNRRSRKARTQKKRDSCSSCSTYQELMEKKEKEKEEQKESIVNMAKGDDRPASVNKMLKRPYKQKENENEKKRCGKAVRNQEEMIGNVIQ